MSEYDTSLDMEHCPSRFSWHEFRDFQEVRCKVCEIGYPPKHFNDRCCACLKVWIHKKMHGEIG